MNTFEMFTPRGHELINTLAATISTDHPQSWLDLDVEIARLARFFENARSVWGRIPEASFFSFFNNREAYLQELEHNHVVPDERDHDIEDDIELCTVSTLLHSGVIDVLGGPPISSLEMAAFYDHTSLTPLDAYQESAVAWFDEHPER